MGMRAGRVPELPFPGVPGIARAPPLRVIPSPIREGVPQTPPLARRPSPASPHAVPCAVGGGGASPGIRSSGGAGRPPHGPRRTPPTPGGSPAGARPGVDRPPTGRPPAHGAWARSPGSLGSRHLFPARLVAADRQAGARQRARAPRTRTWRADGEERVGIHPGWFQRSRGHAATAAPTGGSWSRPRLGPAQARRAGPWRCRSALTLA